MKSALQLRQEHEAARAAEYERVLREATEAHRAVVVPTREAIGAALAAGYRDCLQRPLESFTRSLKTRDEDNTRLAYALHLFCRYPVPRHVQAVWLRPREEGTARFARAERRHPAQLRLRHFEEKQRCFFAVGAGESPFKTIFRDILTKKEVHRFLTCPHGLDYDRAIIWAIARSFTEDNAVALRVAQSRLGEQDYHDAFWRDAVRFFVAHPVSMQEIGDFLDYLLEARRRNPDFSLKGRTLVSLTSLMKVWHRELRIQKTIAHKQWDGLPLDNARYEIKENVWRSTQIITASALAQEGAEMHHCVNSRMYVTEMVEGRTGIFSLTVERKGMKTREGKRALTIELNVDGEIVQARGFGNRQPTDEEREVLRRWMSDNRLTRRSYAWA